MTKIVLIGKSRWMVRFPEENSYAIVDYKGVIASLGFMGVKKSELLLALQEMKNKGHDSAEFGLYGRFLYTSNYSEGAVKAAA